MKACEQNLGSDACKSELEKIVNESLKNVLSKKEEYMLSRHPSLSNSFEGFDNDIDYDDYDDRLKMNRLISYIDSELSRMEDSLKSFGDNHNQLLSAVRHDINQKTINKAKIEGRLKNLEAQLDNIVTETKYNNDRFRSNMMDYIKSLL